MPPTLFLLIGPKGSSKTHIGGVVERRTDICFLRVEPIWLGLQPGQDGWMEVERAVDAMLENHERVMIESLGAGERFPGFLSSLQSRYAVKLIRVLADSDTCLERVRTRNQAEHIDVSDEQVAEYN